MQEFGSTTEVDVTPPSPLGKLWGVVYGICFSRMLLLSPLEPSIAGSLIFEVTGRLRWPAAVRWNSPDMFRRVPAQKSPLSNLMALPNSQFDPNIPPYIHSPRKIPDN